MAMTLEEHHELVDDAPVGAYFAVVQGALNAV